MDSIKQDTDRARRFGWLLFAITMSAVAGCGNSTTVSGKVTYEGRMVTHGSVIFVGSDKTAHSSVIERDGSYTVEALEPGTFSIAVISRDPSQGRSVLRNREPEQPGQSAADRQAGSTSGWFPLPARLESPSSSGLSCTLSAGQVTHDIELK